MTSVLLNQTQEDSRGDICIDDFVGDGDLDRNNITVVNIIAASCSPQPFTCACLPFIATKNEYMSLQK
ncbi:hypothetical protein DPMN_000093 [Dreissena polymorpha]|uniref:Uncharacterized protein n=1 Tax=Dreissena polymorpha TaxID=45954 RepID=A0A9D4RP77_DREPO|nr:hypothetical protein DPMN_000093 [Dreissena polymorpha]